MATAGTETKKSKVITPEFRCSYMSVFSPKQSDDGKSVWSVTAIFESKADFKEMQKIYQDAMATKWPGKTAKQIPGFKSPFRMGVEGGSFDLDKNPEYKGKVICTFRSYNTPPGVVGPDKQPILDQTKFRSGDYARASITAYAYDIKGKGSKGVSFGLSSIIKTRRGEPLVNVSDPETDFKDIPVSSDENEDQFSDDGDSPLDLE